MKTPFGHLTYCSNIHSGETWDYHFAELQANIPKIKSETSPNSPFGIGLRLSNHASIELTNPEKLNQFQTWLINQNCYVFTMNGFPYGDFHDVAVKDQVHTPDWSTNERFEYTIRLFNLLAKLLPVNMQEGGISTSPLSYRFWWKDAAESINTTYIATQNIILVVAELVKIAKETGKTMHLDIEPEPSGLLENGTEFINWYINDLLPMAILHFGKLGITPEKATKYVKRHIQLCYDVCHFGVSFENPKEFINKINNLEIRVGKIQISSALKVDLKDNANEKIKALAQYNEPTYLHQVVAKVLDGTFEKFSDLQEAIQSYVPNKYSEWRVHFHVPLFLENFGKLSSTQKEIFETINLHKIDPFTNHLEIETYTWGVLPVESQIPIDESIIREIVWVKDLLIN